VIGWREVELREVQAASLVFCPDPSGRWCCCACGPRCLAT
jgi:hypothetical protein